MVSEWSSITEHTVGVKELLDEWKPHTSGVRSEAVRLYGE